MRILYQYRLSIFLLICLNIALQVTGFSLMKLSWIHAQHSIVNLINYITVLAFTLTFLRAFVWQHILRLNDLTSSYLSNTVVPSLLLVTGFFIFKEKITIFNLLGTVVILIGLIKLIKSMNEQ